MICKITGCNHYRKTSKPNTGDSWALHLICPCCADELLLFPRPSHSVLCKKAIEEELSLPNNTISEGCTCYRSMDKSRKTPKRQFRPGCPVHTK